MKEESTKFALRTIALTSALLLFGLLPRLPHRFHIPHAVGAIVARLRNSDLSAGDLHAQAAGYYEGIEDKDRIGNAAWHGSDNDLRLTYNFRRHEYKQNVRRPYEAGVRITNSIGMPNAEYGPEKPAHTRRIAWLGDSASVGPFGHSFELLLENRLNEAYTTPEIQKFQVLNFSTPGYSSLQEMDVALDRAPRFQPDVYVVALTVLESEGPARHLMQLTESGIDFKYDYLRKIGIEAGVKATDPKPLNLARLRPFSNQMTQWALQQIRASVDARGARMIIVLVPLPSSVTTEAADFDQLHKIVDGIGVPVIDLRDAYNSADNLEELQVAPPEDRHPNVRGHQMLFDDLYAHLLAQPGALNALTGSESAHP